MHNSNVLITVSKFNFHGYLLYYVSFECLDVI